MGLRSERFQGEGTHWNSWMAGLPAAHLLQTWEWAQVKAQYGWQAKPLIWRQEESSSDRPGDASPAAMAMVLRRQIRVRGLGMPVSVMYIPKGPLLAWSDASARKAVLDDLESIRRFIADPPLGRSL